jgi:hypothetical protein
MTVISNIFSRIFLFLLLLLQGSALLYAQFYESGVNPPSVRWQQINTAHFRVIFPVDIAAQAQYATNVLEYIYDAEGKTMNHLPKKVPVVLHNRPAFSNGFVSWAPKRSEWYITPPQNMYAHNWLEQLALHEYRHVVQTDMLHRHITKAFSYIIGQQAVGVVAGLLPYWFLEGDAVATESALSNSGRGRDPAFEMPLRTIALSGKYQPYDKAFFGSYRNHVPNHYEMGYQMVAWVRQAYGPQFFEQSAKYVARHPYLIVPYPIGVRKQTGHSIGHLYTDAFDDLTRRWTEQEAHNRYDTFPSVNRRTSPMFRSYRSPRYSSDSTYIAMKTGMDQISQWVEIDRAGNERVICTPGFTNTTLLSYANGRITWSENVPDIRWSNRSYSVVKVLDAASGKTHSLTRHSRYFAPALSPNGATIAAVETPLDCASAIVLLDASTGEVKNRMTAPANTQLQTPSWSKDGKYLLAIANDHNGKSIVKIAVASGLWSTVLAPTFDNIANPADGGTQAFFTGHYNGITNIYAVDYQTGAIAQVTASRFGAFDPQPNMDGNKLLFSEYSVNGYNIAELSLNETQWLPVAQLSDYSPKLYETLAEQEHFNLQDSIIPNQSYPVRPFRKWTNLFNVHSWAPLYYKIDVSNAMLTELSPGLVLMSQDLLGNMTSSAGYSWRGYSVLHADFTYKAWYPVIRFNLEHGGDKRIYGRDGATLQAKYQNTQIGVNAQIPFDFTRNRYITKLTPQVQFDYTTCYLYSNTTNDYRHGLGAIIYSIHLFRYLKTATRDLAPPWGVALQTAFKHAPYHTGLFGYMYFMYGRVYLPGIAKHHSLQLSAGWQAQKNKEYTFGSMLAFPRGYVDGRTEKLAVGLAEYRFPFLYPDRNLACFVYLKRLSANIFCHAANNRYQARNIWQSENLLSVGADIMADVNFLRIYYPVNIGLRTVYVPETKDIQPHLLFQISFD